MFADAELVEWLTLTLFLPLAGWGIYVQIRLNELDADLTEIKDTLRLVLNNTAIARGHTEGGGE